MRSKNINVIFTNNNCIGCNRCISGCPIPGANVASFVDGVNKIIVDNSRCIQCGHCISICNHSAREYIDDTDLFFEDLKKGESISLLISPSFYINYPQKAAKILGYLKSLGVNNIWNVSMGADIATWAYVQYLNNNPEKGCITPPCAAAINYIEKQRPELTSHLLPIHSPLMCLAIYLRKYLGQTEKFAFISPCIAKKTEINSSVTKGMVQYNVTFTHLLKKLSDVDIDGYNGQAENLEEGMGNLYPVSGGLRENLEYFLGHGRTILQLWDLSYIGYGSESVADIVLDKDSSVVLDLLQCEHGCILGTGVDKKTCSIHQAMKEYSKIRKKYANILQEKNLYSHNMPRAERLKALNERFKNLDMRDFKRKYAPYKLKDIQLSEDVYNEIYIKMHKTTEASRHIDCQMCGYISCQQMAEAIARGYNTIENCAHYEKAENLRMYTTDSITGLPNKFMMMKIGEQLLRENQLIGYALVQFNIKNFMLFNNRFGYEGANKILFEFGQEVQKMLYENEYLFHIGSDSFVVFLRRFNLESYIYQINNLQLPSLADDQDIQMKLSVKSGIYQPTGEEKDFHEITKYLFSTFLLSKQEKTTDTVFYDKTTSEHIVQHLMLTHQIPKALAEGEFFVMYQPKVRLSDNMLTGGEALVRWNRNGTIIPPGNFIPACESSGLIRDLDFFVLSKVCQAVSRWIKKGLEPVKISVNFSKLHFNQPDVADQICSVVDKWNVPHSLVEIEFTETVYSDAQYTLNKTMKMLKSKDFSASIDDFGTGYSSLSLLQNLEFDVLKLDKSLIDTISPNSQAKTVVTNIIKMAKELNMDVVAEGVETVEVVHLLQELKCDMIQGYVFDKPLMEEEFEKRLNQKHYNVEKKSELV